MRKQVSHENYTRQTNDLSENVLLSKAERNGKQKEKKKYFSNMIFYIHPERREKINLESMWDDPSLPSKDST